MEGISVLGEGSVFRSVFFPNLGDEMFKKHNFSMRSNLVDLASSHMLVSKIKPCKSKYKCLYIKTADGSLNQ